ncbi:MAG: FHA domain-containing protein [Herpetosiphonaceae bacterium]|nr:FHA domain-containing protein [Herpetosiphonaceae bacterium]
MSTCGTCNNQLLDDAAFCENCGSPAARGTAPAALPSPALPLTNSGTPICSQCGKAGMVGEAFCDDCGAPLQTYSPTAQGGAPTSAPVVASSPNRATLRNSMLLIHGSGMQIAFPDKAEVIVGRNDAPSNHFPDIDMTPHNGEAGGVSRRHARISVQQGQIMLEDLDSTNLTRINQQQARPKQPQPLRDGDEVRFGSVVTTFRAS